MNNKEYEIVSIHKWMHEKGFVNEKGEPMVFNDHMFLYEPYADFSQRQVYKKCSQVGVSVMMNIKCPYVMRQFKYNIIYTLPSDSDVEEFVPTKTDKIIAANPELEGALQTTKVGLKQMYDRFWHFKGTRSKTAAIMTTADLLIHDEKDRSDQTIIGDYRSRIKRSTYKGIWELSNPSVVNSGVDVAWKRSDQKEWAIKCSKCEHEQVINWYENVDYQQKEYVCINCGKIIDKKERRLGKWIPTDPDSEVSGYHISQMMAPWISCKELIQEEEETDEEYFHNFVLGEPVGLGEVEDFRSLILEAWTPKDLNSGPYFMGIDIGSTKHYVIGNMQGICRVGKLTTREEAEALIERYNPIVVMDGGPERTWAEEFRRKYPKLWICFYNKDKKKNEKIKWGEGADTGIVFADRSRVIDSVVTAIAYTDILFDLPSEDLDRYIKHWLVMTKLKKINGLGLPEFFWEKNSAHAQDHWVHATVYYWIARSRGHSVDIVASTDNTPLPVVQQDFDGNQEMTDLRELMEEEGEW